MAKSIYLDKELQPNTLMLSDTLGECEPYFEAILTYIKETYAAVSCEWRYYGIAWGWSFVIKSKAKTLCYLIPVEGYFYTAIIFNEKGRLLVAQAELPKYVKQAVEDTKDNPQNIPYDFKISGKDDIEIAKELIEIRFRT